MNVLVGVDNCVTRCSSLVRNSTSEFRVGFPIDDAYEAVWDVFDVLSRAPSGAILQLALLPRPDLTA